MTPNNSTTALQADAKPRKPEKRCVNCHRRGHTVEVCYWPGGGKEGQFPPGFGKRGGANGSANMALNTAPASTANAAIIETSYALMAMTGGGNDEEEGRHTVSAIPVADEPTALAAVALGGGDLLTYVDSGASDHCFANKNDFSAYELFPETREGQAALRGAKFKILGSGTVRKSFISEGRRTSITFHNALHTPDFAANLISVSKFDAARFKVLFADGRAQFIDPHGETFVTASRTSGMYILTQDPPTAALSAKSHEKPTSIDTWHRRFSHAGTSLIVDMARKNLVDGLNITEGEKAPGMCEDCIYGKQMARPYDEDYEPESETLALVHVDLWGPARVRSTGGAKYLMILTDDASSFRKPYFLSDKSGDATLQAIKEYRAESERQTGKKLKKLRFDMGKEFLNKGCEDYCRESGIVLKSPAPYAHAANGVPERANRTTIEGVRCLLCDSGLPPSLWADAAATSIYTRNLIPSSRHPGKVPAEVWTGKRQDVSHLRPFGCTAYAKIPKEVNPSKIGPISVKYSLIGYYDRDAYKLFDKQMGKVIKSRDVIFEEGVGHRTIPAALPLTDSDDIYDIFGPTPTDDTEADSLTPGRVVREALPVAPRTRPTDVLHDAPPMPAQPAMPAGPHQTAPTPPVPDIPRRSTRATRPTTAILQSRESEERLAQAKYNGLDWATDSSRPRTMLAADLPSLHAELDDYMAMLASSSDHRLP
ncbi:hypothetical protein NLJ89_g11264 [Agrocybe chaxingu]|uniref:Integrase catalytic domain-containing protein n=1 Tax=Agrocybe chaxingu TaxID=84603 RepID=A0A9W8JQ92_9AGAR|nr:hypothetical protein NLJ89_g11264 [Agrocybe chaxingu]